jgi:hypothetical protein
VGTKEKILIQYFGKSIRILIKNFVEIISEECFRECKSLCEVVFGSYSRLREIRGHVFHFSESNHNTREYVVFSLCHFFNQLKFQIML